MLSGINTRRILLIVLIAVLVATNCLTLILYLNESKVDEKKLIHEAEDELSRAKFFIEDWYDELSEEFGEPTVYYNELQFDHGLYILTVSGSRIRAVYPRGDRYFQSEYIDYIEFYRSNDRLLYRIYYLNGGEIVYKLN